ncbi:hypothetical protein H4J38_00065 [Colwellia sp. BRX10-3]|nr:hypothetical protein [Colwellia sp. BRX10-3]MBA6389168.1 hypothetical protein [Colwellia sp. BRX10-3]
MSIKDTSEQDIQIIKTTSPKNTLDNHQLNDHCSGLYYLASGTFCLSL